MLSNERHAEHGAAADSLRSPLSFWLFGARKKGRSRAVVAFGVAFLVTCAGCSSRLSEQQAKALADEILKHTPEFVHFEPGAKFRWAVFSVPSENPYPDVTDRVRTGLRERYVLYSDAGAIPPETRLDLRGAEGYRGGFLFSVNIKRVARKKVEVEYKDFEHALAASEQTVVYEWTNGAWKVVSKSPLLVS